MTVNGLSTVAPSAGVSICTGDSISSDAPGTGWPVARPSSVGVGRPSSRKVTGSRERNALCAERTAWSSAQLACADDIPAGRRPGPR